MVSLNGAPGGAVSSREEYQYLAELIVARRTSAPIASEARWEAIAALALDEGVGPLLQRALSTPPMPGLPATVAGALERCYQEALYDSLLYENARTRVCRQFRERAIPVLLLKGAALAFRYYENPATRVMGDLDLLVPASRIEEAARCLEADGYQLQPLPRSLLPGMNRPTIHHVYFHPRTRALVELHWDLHGLPAPRAEALAEIWAHAQPAGGSQACSDPGEARVMSVGHLIPLLCAHMTLQHKRASLLWLYDLHRVLQALDPRDAALAQDVAARWNLIPCVAHTLLRVEALFNTPLPASLAGWAVANAEPDSLQARVVRRALDPGTPDLPDGGLINLAMDGDWRRLRSLLPAPEALRERLNLAPDERIARAYLALAAGYLRKSPDQVRRLWSLWRGGPAPTRSRSGTGSHTR